ncbi:DNA-directed RNA polymerase subunit omega [Sinorhizobium meliloti]|uniref:DNA-directed RNA polymerase subunit omega n=1 Tax=Rhizobium meliloti TaxID=382 RepID=UPI000312D9F1|nr:DNA-directed RNA polymerase subunit omega [Sinorhizobium meliloti]MDE3762605.1 DNA-directed RNA polymerase subunit omega [Sinorhizobium meliloti]MDW9358881.1 DNA-directed RNA polymerase subunit omega [Sinorhizobium meliloti]MDW9658226.1 DNA-directed RNA polymerase subunit omega [Sinorhizobium meliloti]MDW9901610.1 DNA-directed RNA polymerase subunit omega [Sinorhizobium meliloti]MDW9909337.1 DNA-directed RNA polymerase subunit omega [Sinorhizobium meliloti]
MDPFIVYNCEKFVPNRFALALAAASRCRVLNRGADPRTGELAGSGVDLALREIGAGAFSKNELSLFLAPPHKLKAAEPATVRLRKLAS